MKRLYLLTNGYPYTVDELPFIQPEIEYLKKKYDITLIACLDEANINISTEEVNRLADNGIVSYRYISRRKSIFRIISGIVRCCNLSFLREVKRVLDTKNRIPERLALIFCHYTEVVDLYDYLYKNDIITVEYESIFYSYWFHKAAHAGIILKKKKYAHLRIVSRIHGYDLYNDQGIAEYQPFKPQMDKEVDRLLFICEQGKRYYLDNFASKPDDKKYIVNRLGVFDPGFHCENRKRDNEIHLISCSTVYNIKRINLIVDALSLIDDIRVHWVHFGDGPDYDELAEHAKRLLGKKDNIDHELRGRVSNQEVLKYYKENSPDCIINVSKSEGSPVSLQEALSFGMLIIATDVGGCSEMVEGNGVLLSFNPPPVEIAEAIRTIARKSATDFDVMQRISCEIWERDFNRKNNLVDLEGVFENLYDR